MRSKIERWAKERNLHNADPSRQVIKLMEEIGEIARAIGKGKTDEIIDGIGDCYVVLTILSMQIGTNIDSCIEQAWNEIKDRKGKTVNGIFVKEADRTNVKY